MAAPPRGKLLSTLSTPTIQFADHATPCRQTLGRMLLHPLRELRRAGDLADPLWGNFFPKVNYD
jgi:hypothetical protein